MAETYNDYPQSATNNAKRALKYKADNPDNDCGTRVGWERANQLAKRERISRDTIARMASFKRHQQHSDVPYSEGCGGLMWDAWGGTSGIEWAIRKLEQIDKKAASKMASQKFAFAALQDEDTRLNKDSGTMLGVALISEGEALGHDLQVDSRSLETVVDAIGESIPAYITHRGAIFDDRLLREIGVFNNIRVEGDRVLGDFEAFESFKEDESRKFNRLFELAEKMPGKFGLSIVFSADKVWATEEGDVPFSFQDKEPPEDAMFEFPSIRVLEVSSADFVDSPAANERGLFSQIDIKPNNKMTKPELQDAFDALSAEKETFETQLSEVQEQLSTAKASIESLCADKEALETELSEKSAKVTELEGLLSEKTEAFEAKETEAAELQTKFDEAEAEKVKLSDKVDLLSSLIKGENDAPAAFGDDVTGDEYIPSKEARDKAIEEFAKSKGISLFSATVELSRIRPELFKSE